MSSFTSLRDQFLIAMPQMDDPRFSSAVVYVFEHSEQGAAGVVINHPTDITVGALLEYLRIPRGNRAIGEYPVFQGGPVSPRQGFVLHRPGETSDTIFMSSSKDDLTDVAKADGPRDVLLTLGYSGWEEGQLEAELAGNYWLTSPASPTIIFETPSRDRWRAAAALIGVRVDRLVGGAGHA